MIRARIDLDTLAAKLLALAESVPGRTVALVATTSGVTIGVLNFPPQEDDFYYDPVSLEEFDRHGLNALLIREID